MRIMPSSQLLRRGQRVSSALSDMHRQKGINVPLSVLYNVIDHDDCGEKVGR